MIAPGQIIRGTYRLERQLGEGGMGTVWKAIHTKLDRPVAIKFLTPFGPEAARMQQRFVREAQLAASIEHPNVVHIFDFGDTGDGTLFIVMELLQGRDLADELIMETRMSLAQLVELIADTLSGLAAVHQTGIVHRDIKPENIFLAETRGTIVPKLIDFGLSLGVYGPDAQRTHPMLTKEGVIVGTLEYMSAEQARCIKDIDLRTDLYSMGVVMYRCLTGKLPFEGEHTGDRLLSVMRGKALPVNEQRSDVSTDLSLFVAKAMNVDRAARFQTALEMRAALLEAAKSTTNLNDARIAPYAGFDSMHPNAVIPAVHSLEHRSESEAERADTAFEFSATASASDPDWVETRRPKSYAIPFALLSVLIACLSILGWVVFNHPQWVGLGKSATHSVDTPAQLPAPHVAQTAPPVVAEQPTAPQEKPSIEENTAPKEKPQKRASKATHSKKRSKKHTKRR